MKTPLTPRADLEVETNPSGAFTDMIGGAFYGDLAAVARALRRGARPERLDPDSGLSVLHIAVGNNDFALCRLLIEEHKAPFGADRFGRWPSVIAIECRAGDELSDYIVEKEAAFLAGSAE